MQIKRSQIKRYFLECVRTGMVFGVAVVALMLVLPVLVPLPPPTSPASVTLPERFYSLELDNVTVITDSTAANTTTTATTANATSSSSSSNNNTNNTSSNSIIDADDWWWVYENLQLYIQREVADLRLNLLSVTARLQTLPAATAASLHQVPLYLGEGLKIRAMNVTYTYKNGTKLTVSAVNLSITEQYLYPHLSESNITYVEFIADFPLYL